MTWSEYRDMVYKTYENGGYDRIGCGGPVLLACLLLAFLLCGCKSIQYVPVETVKTEYVHDSVTIEKTDTVDREIKTIVREADSAEIARLAKEYGFKLDKAQKTILVLQKEVEREKSKEKEIHTKDSVRVEEKEIPVPVERKLSRWEQIKMDYGAVSIGVSLAAIIAAIAWLIVWIRRRI